MFYSDFVAVKMTAEDLRIQSGPQTFFSPQVEYLNRLMATINLWTVQNHIMM